MNAVQMMTGAWATAGPLPEGTVTFDQNNQLVRLDDGRVLLAGGTDAVFAATATAALFDPATDTWSTTGSMSSTRRIHTMTLLPDGKVLAAGGIAGPFRFPTPSVASADLFDPKSGTWSPTGSMTEPRLGHTATLLADGRVLVAGGGRVRGTDSGRTLATAELYDPATGLWTATETMTDARVDSQSVLLPDGRVLLVGGTVETGHGTFAHLAFCELFDPILEKWTTTGSMSVPRNNHQATLLPGGDVLVTGGTVAGVVPGTIYDPHSHSSVEMYSIEAETWTPVAPLPIGRARHQALVLRDGRLLVSGGADEASLQVGYASTVIYDPLSGKWSATGGLATGRYDHGAVLLEDGRVLAAGGLAAAQTVTPTTELFTA
ncbi:Kelch repeat-containing protein [Kribbella antibiotica]|nr:kelch repeat-containing protein [Kribbella antibiotica]